jgi:hypothetical protein
MMSHRFKAVPLGSTGVMIIDVLMLMLMLSKYFTINSQFGRRVAS